MDSCNVREPARDSLKEGRRLARISRRCVLSLSVLALVLLPVGQSDAAPFVYITNYTSNNVSVIEPSTNTVVATVPVGSNPVAFGLFIGPRPFKTPTLNKWGIVILALILVTCALVVRKRKKGA
jgi:YVTN family beta-propeller protein